MGELPTLTVGFYGSLVLMCVVWACLAVYEALRSGDWEFIKVMLIVVACFLGVMGLLWVIGAAIKAVIGPAGL
jgi:hypothetical protein